MWKKKGEIAVNPMKDKNKSGLYMYFFLNNHFL